MKFALAIHAAPFSSSASQTALKFAQALLAEGHDIYRVFFYQDGVHTANELVCPPQDEQNLCLEWQSLARAYSLDLVVCIAAALRRGVINAEEAERYDKATQNLAPTFSISGLGQLLDAAVKSDRLITFGA